MAAPAFARRRPLSLPAVAQHCRAATARRSRPCSERGHLICATTDPLPGFAQLSTDGRWIGFDVDFCRAVAAAVFGDPSKLEFRALSGDSRFAAAADRRDRPHRPQRAMDHAPRHRLRRALCRRRCSTTGRPSWCRSRSVWSRPTSSTTSARLRPRRGRRASKHLREFFFVNQATYTEVLYEDREDLAVAYRSGPLQRGVGPGELAQRHAPQPAGSADAPHPARAHQQRRRSARWSATATTNGSRSSSGRCSR